MAEAPVTPADILAFWRDAGPERWYTRDDAFDAEVRRRFLRPVAAARQPANCRHGKRAMTARWRSSSCSTSFPATCSAATRRTYASDALARDVAHRAIERGVDARIDPALRRIPLSAVHAFGAPGRPVALHRAVASGRPCRKPEMGASTTPISSAGSAAFPTATACWAARPRRRSRPSWTKAAFRR